MGVVKSSKISKGEFLIADTLDINRSSKNPTKGPAAGPSAVLVPAATQADDEGHFPKFWACSGLTASLPGPGKALNLIWSNYNQDAVSSSALRSWRAAEGPAPPGPLLRLRGGLISAPTSIH